MKLVPKRLSQKLILSFTILMMVVGAIAAYIHVKSQESQLLEAMIQGADQLSGSITSATWHAMLADHREDVYQTMETIAQKQGIDRIRIFNKEGQIKFSTVAGDTGQVDKDAEACSMCHLASEPLVKVDVPFRSRVYTGPDGHRKLAMITPIYNEPSCSDADCHAHPASQNVLGVVDVSLTLDRVDADIASIRTRVLAITLTIVVVMAMFIVYFTRHFVEAPIKRLIEGTKAVSAMQLDKPIEIDSSEELGELAESFDTMRVRLKHAMEELNEFTQALETKVEERTEQLKVAHQKLLHSDRLASLGQLSASVAHEINNPLSGVLNLSMLMQRIIRDNGVPPERVGEFRKYLSQVVNETARVGRIVQDLLAFSRRSKQKRAMVHLNTVITTTVNLISHKLKLMNVGIRLELDESAPPVNCDASQIQQVLINIIMNGAEAAQVRNDGMVTVHTRVDLRHSEYVIDVHDNGEGIPEAIVSKIFDPFFTTKGEGKGVGLGLAVVYGIIESHNGDIDVDSKAGNGTTFRVRLPLGDVQTATKLSEAGHAA